MITKRTKISFILHRVLYFHLPPFPFYWSSDYSKLSVSSSLKEWSAWCVGWLVTISIGIGNLYLIFTHIFIETRHRLEFVHLFVLTFGGISMVTISSIGGMILWKISEFLPGFNHMNDLDTKMTEDYQPDVINDEGQLDDKTETDYGGWFCILTSIGLASGIIWTTLLCIHQEYDSIGFVLDELLPDSKYRDMSTIVAILIFRLVMFTICMVEMSRTLTMLLLCAITMMCAGIRCLEHLMYDTRNVEEFIKYYNRLTLAYRYIEYTLSTLIAIVITIVYWLIIIGSWVYIRGSKLLDKSLWFIIGLVVIGALVGSGYGLMKGKEGYELLENMFLKNRIIASWKYSKERNRKCKIVLKGMQGLRKVRIKCGAFYDCDENLLKDFFNGVIGRVVDSVLMFDLESFQ